MIRHATGLLLIFGLLQAAFAFETELRFVEGLTREGFSGLTRTVPEQLGLF